MPLPVPFIRPQPAAEPPAYVRVVSRADVQWNRKIFRAPPLVMPAPTAITVPKAIAPLRPAPHGAV